MDTTTATVGAVGLLGFLMGFMAFWAVWYILVLVSRWKVFDKAGIAGWKSLIPVYSDYCTYRIAWKGTYFWILFAIMCVSSIVSNRITGYTDDGSSVPMILTLLSSACGLAVTVINLLLNIKLSNRFGHGILFGLGLMFLTPVFTLILGLGDSRYQGNPEEGLPPQFNAYGYR